MSVDISSLSSYFTTLTKSLMAIERQPLLRMQTSRDEVDVRRSAYIDLNAQLKALQTAAQDLRDTPLTKLAIGRKATVANVADGATVLTATPVSTAALATYQIDVTSVAREERIWSNQQAGSSQALGLSGSFQLNGVQIDVAVGDSLNTLAAAINSKTFASGQEVAASVVDNRLVIASRHGGTGTLTASDDAGSTVLLSLGIVDAQGAFVGANHQAGASAVFTVNGVPVTRTQNTGLTDVIDGVTLNLAADAAGQSAALTIGADISGARTAIDALLSKFNSVQAYLANKTATTFSTVEGVTTYTRGLFADDTVFADLRGDLFNRFMADTPNSGAFKSLRAIGIALDDNLQASVIDSAKLEAALADNLDDVRALFEAAAGSLDTRLAMFTGVTTGYMDSAIRTFDVELADADRAISDFNARLVDKEEALTDQFAQMQALLVSMSYQQQQWSSIYGGLSQYG